MPFCTIEDAIYGEGSQIAAACIDCHGADKGDADAFEHEGALIATLVTPKDCGVCHEKEAKEMTAEILSAVTGFCNADFTDDVTLLAMRVQ